MTPVQLLTARPDAAAHRAGAGRRHRRDQRPRALAGRGARRAGAAVARAPPSRQSTPTASRTSAPSTCTCRAAATPAVVRAAGGVRGRRPGARDGLHASFRTVLALGGWRTPLIVTWHDRAPAEGARAHVLRLMERRVVKAATVVLGTTSALVDRYGWTAARDAQEAKGCSRPGAAHGPAGGGPGRVAAPGATVKSEYVVRDCPGRLGGRVEPHRVRPATATVRPRACAPTAPPGRRRNASGAPSASARGPAALHDADARRRTVARRHEIGHPDRAFARENRIPLLGLCLGLQCIVIEAARNLADISDADSTEFDPATAHPVISTMAEQLDIVAGDGDLGGTLRGSHDPAKLAEGSIGARCTTARSTSRSAPAPLRGEQRLPRGAGEEGRHRLLRLPPDGKLVEEPSRPARPASPYLVATQAHPELRSRPTRPHPLFAGLVKAAVEREIESSTPVVRLPGRETLNRRAPRPPLCASTPVRLGRTGMTGMTIKDTPEEWEVRNQHALAPQQDLLRRTTWSCPTVPASP
ncbi:CTP synthase [Streptomyces hirsutus]